MASAIRFGDEHILQLSEACHIEVALPLLSLSQAEELFAISADCHAVLGWNHGKVGMQEWSVRLERVNYRGFDCARARSHFG